MKKLAVIFYHKNIDKIYKQEWIDNCIASIFNQTITDVDWFELDYGGTNKSYTGTVNFESIEMPNHIFAINYLFDKLFKLGYDVVFNTNMDDYYHPQRFELQLKAIEQGYQLVSSNFKYINDKNKFLMNMDMVSKGDIKANLDINHNVIAHPVIAMHRSFWDTTYNDLLGYEDMEMWQRQIKNGKKFIILPEYLLNYRIHRRQVSRENVVLQKLN